MADRYAGSPGIARDLVEHNKHLGLNYAEAFLVTQSPAFWNSWGQPYESEVVNALAQQAKQVMRSGRYSNG